MKLYISNLMLAALCVIAISLLSCSDTFLEKPTGSELNTDSIFSNAAAAKGAIARAYARSLTWEVPYTQFNFDGQNRGNGLLHGTEAHIANEINEGYTWEYSYRISTQGMAANRGDGWPQCSGRYLDYWTAIRQCNLVIDNIDKVSDMSDTEKKQVKGEMRALIAYTYVDGFKSYGGMPLVKKTLTTDDKILIKRSSLQSTVDFVVGLCDEAAADLPSTYSSSDIGRITKGAALAIKAEILTYAARPLFNATPYLPGSADSLWSFGSYSATRWQKAIDANLAVLSWAASSSVALINTGNPLKDFSDATSKPGNAEVLLAYKDEYGGGGSGLELYYNPHQWEAGYNNVSYNTLIQFRKADGTDQTWADETPAPFDEYFTKADEMEPRFKASIARIAGNAENNPGDQWWSASNITNGGGLKGPEGCGRKIKFWANAGTRTWFEFPLYRLAEFYLNLAEGYNEIDNPSKSKEYMNIVRQRGGIPDVTETDKTILRSIIQREWSAEFFLEQHRIFDLKHWKIAEENMGGPRYTFRYTYPNGSAGRLPSDFSTYKRDVQITGYWNINQHLFPFPIGEVNKGYLVQNPGY